MENRLHDIAEIYTLKMSSDVNRFLYHGWILLEVYKTGSNHEGQTIHYVVGRPSNITEVPKTNEQLVNDEAYYK